MVKFINNSFVLLSRNHLANVVFCGVAAWFQQIITETIKSIMLIQLLHIINLITLLFSTTGVLAHQHYCQDKLKTVSFYTTTKDCCKKQKKITQHCSAKTPQIGKKKCCENKTIFSVDSSAQQLLDVDKNLSTPWSFAYIPIIHYCIEPVVQPIYWDAQEKWQYYTYKAPPNQVATYLLFCSFLC